MSSVVYVLLGVAVTVAIVALFWGVLIKVVGFAAIATTVLVALIAVFAWDIWRNLFAKRTVRYGKPQKRRYRTDRRHVRGRT